MDDLRKLESEEWIFDENITEIQIMKKSEVYSFNEYLIEIVKTTDGKGCYARIYKLVASEPSCDDPQTALKDTISFLIERQ